jgi:hypothetical protein
MTHEKDLCRGVVAVAGTFLLAASYVLANEPKGEGLPDYSGVTGM